LVVQAKLIMGARGLSGFEVIEQQAVSDKQTADVCIQSWRLGEIVPTPKSN